VKGKAEHAEFLDCLLCFFYGALAFKRIDRRPRLQDAARIIIAHLSDVIIRAGRRDCDGLDIKGHQHGLNARLPELRDDIRLALGRPGTVPVLGERLHIRPLRFDPRRCVGVAMDVDDSHGPQIFI